MQNNLREEQIKENLDRILSKSEFSYNKSGDDFLEFLGRNIKDIIEAIKERIKSLFNLLNVPKKLPQFNNPITDSSALGLKIAGVLVICLVIAVLIFILLKNFRGSKRLKQKEDQELLYTLRDPDVMEQQALEYCKKGEFRIALRFLYLGLLLKLNEMNLIKINKSKSNRQYLNELRNGKIEGFNKVAGLTEDFNRYWYGNRYLDSKGYELIFEVYTSIIAEVVK